MSNKIMPKKDVVFFSILYNPELNAIENIIKANKFGFKSIVYLNRVSPKLIDELRLLDVIILGNNENVGLGKAFAELENYLIDKEISYYLYFDQDTIVPDESWVNIMNTYCGLMRQSRVGMIFYGSSKETKTGVVISSGCFFSMHVIQAVGNHSSDFFVEGVDYEFCLRLKSSDYRISFVYLPEIDHKTLQDRVTIKIFGISLELRVYGDNRLRDFNHSHKKLLKASHEAGQYRLMLFFVKSFIAFNVREFYSRALIRVGKCY